MRRPALYRPHTSHTTGWSHPYAPGPFSPYFYNDGGTPAAPPAPPAPAPVPSGQGEPPKPGPPAPRTFTQEEVEALAAREKAQGKRSAAKEFAEKHGFSTVEDAEAFIAAARKAQDDSLSEQERKARELADGQAKLDKERAALAAERAATRREKALARLGASDDDLDDAAVILERALRDIADPDDTVVAAEAAKLKERRPELFGRTAPPTPGALPPAPGGAPAGGPPPRQAPAGRPGDRGREMARKRGFLKDSA
ncbi:hypothetical protein [Streptomyces xanthochromogenes]